MIVNHIVNWLSPMKERVTIVNGETGTFVADTSSGDLTFFANGTFPLEWESISAFRGVSEGDVTRYAFPKREPLRVEHEAFRDAVLGLRQDVVTMDRGFARSPSSRASSSPPPRVARSSCSRMRVVIASRIFAPEPAAAAFRLAALAEALSERGAEVTVLTTRAMAGRRPGPVCGCGAGRCCGTVPATCAATCST